ncbi:MAG: IgGFc-binding protein [Nannocystaceae bacterium]|nr:IgGFc-binding protein [Nannocystaceae bacterium]
MRLLPVLAVPALALACSSSAPSRDTIGVSLDGGELTAEGGSGGSGSASASVTSAPQSSGPGSDTAADGSGGLKLDVGGVIDLGGDDTGGAVPPSCDNIEDFPDTSVGCEFWAAQVPSSPSALPYGISVGNPGQQVANVVIEDMRGPGGTLRQITAVQLDPTASQLVSINGNGGLLPAENHVVAGQGLTAHGGFRITADVPITAMQIFPVGGGPSHVAEASLLLPINALDVSYLSVGYPHYGGGAGWTVVVATQDATTVSTTQGDVMLDAFDTWTFVSGSDATGFFVGADAPVAVFSGTECTMVPGLPWYACDHIEEQVVPLASWGQSYVAPRHPQRVPAINPTPETVYWRVVAAADDTTITLHPPVAGNGGTITLASIGDFYEFNTPESFTADGDQPFMLLQYMSGCYNVVVSSGAPDNCDQGATGDPYMIQVTPVEQWLTSLPFLTDTSYPRDFVMLMREVGTTVSIDCLGVVDDTHFTAIPGTSYEVGYVDLDIDGLGGEGNCVDGQQFLQADAPVGVLVGGVDWATSYGYPGGMSLGSLWTPPTEPPG